MRAKTLFYALIGMLLVSSIVGVAAYTMLDKKLQASVNTITERQVEVRVAEERLQNLRSLQTQLQGLGSLRADIKNILPIEKNQSAVIAQLVSAARRNGISLSSISFAPDPNLPSSRSQLGPSTISSHVSSIGVTIQAEPTSYGRIKGFLSDLKSLQRHVSLKTITINKTEKENSLTFLADLEVHTYTPAEPEANTTEVAE